jgi:CheY-like chemotaxis protein/two-component sensor histidine kinase
MLEEVDGPLTQPQIKSVTTISTSGTHLLTLINDILDLSKIEAGKLELNLDTVNVDEFCQSCLVFVRTQAMQKHIGVAFEHDGRAAEFVADPKRLKQILVNLLTNAVKFTPEGGRIGLTVAAPEGEDVVRFTVWDSGIGIAKEDAVKLFQAFTQIDSGLSRSQEGTGLGLALVAKLVELHGGSVSLESDPGQGSRFIVTLPLTTAPADETTEGTEFIRRGTNGAMVTPLSVSSPTTSPQNFRHALVIEDDPTAGKQLMRYLDELGLTSALHVCGWDSVETVLRERPDVILLDLQMPGESGWVVLTRLKEHPQTRDIPVVIVSVVDEPEKSRARGATAHFTKPVTRQQLAAFFQRNAAVQPSAAMPQHPQPGTPQSGPIILLAEDNAANIQTVGGYLEKKGYAMNYAVNGLIAVTMAQELRPALILMDIQMPVMDGLTAIRAIRADVALQEIPIVALTALAMNGDRERCLAAGATDYMSKPVKLKELATLVERLLLQRDAQNANRDA